MRVVLDTNVLIAAFVSRGLCAELFEHVVGSHTLIVSEHVLEEFERVLVSKLGFGTERVSEAVALLRRVGDMVDPEPLQAPICRDPDDDEILALARAGDVSCLVTGDDDLLTIGSFEGIPILTPRAFWELEAQAE